MALVIALTLLALYTTLSTSLPTLGYPEQLPLDRPPIQDALDTAVDGRIDPRIFGEKLDATVDGRIVPRIGDEKLDAMVDGRIVPKLRDEKLDAIVDGLIDPMMGVEGLDAIVDRHIGSRMADEEMDTRVDGSFAPGMGDESEPIALLIGKDVKRMMRRKGPFHGIHKDSKHREQHQTLDSRAAGSQEWFPHDSELEHILDPVSLEEPEDIELKKAIAQLLKEVAGREEKRKKKQNLKSNQDTVKVGEEPQKAQSKITDHLDEAKSYEDNSSDDFSDESSDEDFDHQDNVSDAIDYLDSGDVSDESDLNDDDFESTEDDYDHSKEATVHRIGDNHKEINHHDDKNNYDYILDTVNNEKNNRKGIKHDKHQDGKFRKEKHNFDDDLGDKINRHQSHQIHGSKKILKEEGNSNSDSKNKEHKDDSESISLEKSQDIIGKPTHVNNINENNSQLVSKHPEHRDHEKDDTHQNKQPNIDQKISQELDNNNSNDDISESRVQEDWNNSHNHNDAMINTDQKENAKHIELIHEKHEEKFPDNKNHYKDNNVEKDQESVENESDEKLDQSSHNPTNDQLYSFENYNIVKNDRKDEAEHPNDLKPLNILVDQSKYLNDVANKLPSDGDIKKPEIENYNHQNDHDLKLKSPINDLDRKSQPENNNEHVINTGSNPSKDEVKESQTEENNHQHDLNSKTNNQKKYEEKHHHEYDSVEIRRYHNLPLKRYNSRDLNIDKLSKRYRTSNKKRPIKQYTLSFFLKR